MKRLFILLVLAVLALASFTDKADAQCKQQLVSSSGVSLFNFVLKSRR